MGTGLCGDMTESALVCVVTLQCTLVCVVTLQRVHWSVWWHYRVCTGLYGDITACALVCVVTLQSVHWSVWWHYRVCTGLCGDCDWLLSVHYELCVVTAYVLIMTDYIEHIDLCGGWYSIVIMKIIMFFILCSTKCLTAWRGWGSKHKRCTLSVCK